MMDNKLLSFARYRSINSNWGAAARRAIVCIVVGVGLSFSASAQTNEENLEKGAATTEQNYLNVPFVKPKNWKTPYTGPSYWPEFYNRGPIDRSPANKPSKVLVMGSGSPQPALILEINPHERGILQGTENRGWLKLAGNGRKRVPS